LEVLGRAPRQLLGLRAVEAVSTAAVPSTKRTQVKRTDGTITRPKIDELRGALPYHKAIRGTIITLGGFAKGAQDGALFPGAAPITLIDGRRLLDLCVKHEVGVKRRPVEIYEIDEAFFTEKFAREGRKDITASMEDDVEEGS